MTSSSDRQNNGADASEHDSLLSSAERGLGQGVAKAEYFWNDFCDFILSDGVLKVAIGLIIAKAFGDLVQVFIADILLPPIACIPVIHRNFEEKFLTLKAGPNYASNITNGYNTVAQAQADGAVTWGYGLFIQQCINFVSLGASLYIIGSLYTRFTHDEVIKRTVKCKYCRKYISEKAKRCVNCTSWQDGREDK